MAEDNLEEPKRRGRGRPIGSGGKGSSFSRYNPKRWHPEFDLMVVESIAGMDNQSIGDKYGYTKEHVSNILSTEEAKKVKDRIRGTIEKETDLNIKERVSRIGEKVLKHVEKFVEDENGLAEKNPFYFIDRVVKIGESMGSMGKNSVPIPGNNIINNGSMIVMNGDRVTDLKNALDNSMSLESIEVEPVKNEIKLIKSG